MNLKDKKYKILFSGGGTGGSVAPLLAVAEELKFPSDKGAVNSPLRGLTGVTPPHHKTPSSSPLSGGEEGFEFLWLGTKYGPERGMVEKAGIKFRAISGGKWRRYFSLKNLADIFRIKLGFFQAFFIMLKWCPSLVMSAGSFVSVPVVWAAWVLRVPVLIHQQDVRPGLANKLMAPLAKIITVTFEKSLADYGKKAVWTGNPVRQNMKNPHPSSLAGGPILNINKNLPIVLILGGGTGAMAINKLVEESLSELTKFYQIIHVTGKNKSVKNYELKITNYVQYEFLDANQMFEALKLAEVAVTRAGMSFLTELSYLHKPSIIIPLPDSHQEENAEMFKEAASVLEQKNLTPAKFTAEIKNLINNKELQKKLSENMGRVMKSGANEAMVKILLGLLK